MTKPETEIGGENRRFPATSWSIVAGARDKGSAEYKRALERLTRLYWKPVYCLIRRSWGQSNEEAKDLTQEFFVSVVLEGGLIDKFTPQRGSFRAFLKTAVTNFMRDAAKAAGRQKRGGDARTLSLQITDFDIGEIIPDAHALSPEEVFDEAWKNLVLARAVEVTEQRLRSEGKEVYFEIFKRYDLSADSKDLSYKVLGEQLGLSADTVKNYLTRAREVFRDAVSKVICDYVDNEQDLSIEMRELFGA